MTDRAAKRICDLITADAAYALRIGLKKGGCAGMEYTMELVEEAQPNDLLVEHQSAKVVIAPTAQMFLFGTEIDYETSLSESGFKFRNPNVADSCGCGESINFKDVSELMPPSVEE